MKKLHLCLIVLSMFCNSNLQASDTLLIQFLENTKTEISSIQDMWLDKLSDLKSEINKTEQTIYIFQESQFTSNRQLVNLLLEKEKLRSQFEDAEEDFQTELSKIRYEKGIELIKMLYEKILGLDHHFTSLQTYQNVIMLSNPNTFPEFQGAKDVIKNRLGKKNSIQLPSMLETNPYISMTYSLVATFFGNGEKKKRESDLDKIACILDFTVRMNADLNTIYYETEFLKEHNRSLKAECIELFKDYSKVVSYHTTLPECRKEDDWEQLDELLESYMVQLETDLKDPTRTRNVYKMQVDLEFSIDRLLQFMEKYNAFISQGEKYYQKFQTILGNYSNETVCESQLPRQFTDLKKDIEMSILKFNEAYNISELQGSKLKDLMYGLSE